MLLRVRKLAQHANSLDEFAHWAQYANSSTSSHVRTEYAKSCLSTRTRTFYLERKRTLFVIRIRCIQYAYVLGPICRNENTNSTSLRSRAASGPVRCDDSRKLELRAEPGESTTVERGERRKQGTRERGMCKVWQHCEDC